MLVLLGLALIVFSARRKAAQQAAAEARNSAAEDPGHRKREPQTIGAYKLDPASEVKGGYSQECHQGQVTLIHSIQDYQACASQLKDKEIDDGTDPFSLDAPAHISISLVGSASVHSSVKSDLNANVIEVIPLADPSVPDYGKAYPSMSAGQLRDLLKQRPQMMPEDLSYDLPDLDLINIGHDFYGKVYFVDLPTMEGISYLTRYSQEPEEALLNSDQLSFVFQGLTRDGRYYISAHLAIRHPSLPEDYDAASKMQKPGMAYLLQVPKQLDALPDDSFQPPLPRLWELMGSISVKENEVPKESKAQ